MVTKNNFKGDDVYLDRDDNSFSCDEYDVISFSIPISSSDKLFSVHEKTWIVC